MARYAAPIEDTIGYEIYQRWVRYCTEHNLIVDPFVFFDRILIGQDHYPVSRGCFRHWLDRLQRPAHYQADPYVWRDETTHAWRLRDVIIREK